jgi:hypothetical protein
MPSPQLVYQTPYCYCIFRCVIWQILCGATAELLIISHTKTTNVVVSISSILDLEFAPTTYH